MKRMTRRAILWPIILTLSVGLRVIVALYLGDVVDAPPMLTDQRSYHALGTRLIAGHGFSFGEGWYPFTPPDTPTAHWSFLYSLFVAGVYRLVGIHPLAVRLAGAVLSGLLLPLVVHRLTRRLFPGREAVAMIAATSSAVYAFFILYSATLMTEAFYIIALLWSMERALAVAEDATPMRGLGLGASLAISALLRQSVLPWVAVLFVWLLAAGWRSGHLRRTLGPITLAGAILLVSIAPFTLRNWLVYDEFLLLNSNAGYAMYSAQHPMHGTSFQEFAAAPLPDDLRGLNEAQLDRALMGRGIGFILADPARYLTLSLSRIADYFQLWPTADTSLVNNVGRLASFTLFLPFMIYGVGLALWERRGVARGRTAPLLLSPVGLIIAFIVFYSLLHIFTWAMPRYRLPVDAAALPFAALALTSLARQMSSRRSYRISLQGGTAVPNRQVTRVGTDGGGRPAPSDSRYNAE